MSDSDETRTITGWRTASKFYRQSPGLGWLLALLAVPLLLGLIGWAGLDRSNGDTELTMPTVDPSATLSVPEVTEPNVDMPNVSFAPLSILRVGNGLTLSGDLPDLDAKTALMDSLRGAFGPDINFTDNLNIRPGIPALDFSGLGELFKAAVDIPDFSFDLNGDTVRLTGTAPNEVAKTTVEAAARAAWPELQIVNDIQVPAAGAPAPPVAPAPGPGAGECADLQADITGLLRAPINFDSAGSSLAGGSEQMLSQVADKLKACPDARVEVVGHTDNSGSDAINIPLSTNRAKSVADYLVSQGVAGDHVTSRGVGAAEPVASNATPEGRAQNRRVAIIVVG